MSSRPSLTVAVHMARHRQTLSDQLVLGLVTGGLLGPGLSISGRESDCIRFRKLGGILRAAPDRGEILLGTDDRGDTLVECRMWCGGLDLRRFLAALLLGASTAGLLLAAFSLLSVVGRPRWLGGILAGLLAATLSFAVGRWLDRARLRRQVEAYLHNTTYLKAI